MWSLTEELQSMAMLVHRWDDYPLECYNSWKNPTVPQIQNGSSSNFRIVLWWSQGLWWVPLKLKLFDFFHISKIFWINWPCLLHALVLHCSQWKCIVSYTLYYVYTRAFYFIGESICMYVWCTKKCISMLHVALSLFCLCYLLLILSILWQLFQPPYLDSH